VLGAHDWPAAAAALRSLAHAPKLEALRDLLVTCGIVAPDAQPGGKQASSVPRPPAAALPG
jgi:hypothetical protein